MSMPIVERMREPLREILVHCYPLAGRLTWTKVVELGDFSLNDQSVKELIPTVDYTCLIEELPLLLAQVTKIHGGEAIAIGITWSHPLGDGSAAFHFVN
ncbi:hypothetical protein AHAS_Ahas06G0157400 [Arachis hypogaea]